MTLPLSQKKLVLLLSGMNLMIIQFVMIRSFSSILSGTEIVVMIVTLSFFAGHSVGYFCSDRISAAAFKIISLLVLALHLTLPFSIRYLSGFLFGQGAAWLTLLAAVFVSAFCLSSYYSLLLPRFIAQEGRESVGEIYRQELIGALAGLFLIFASTLFPHGSTGLMVVYLLSLSAILHCFWRSRVLLAVACSLVAAYIGLAPRFEAGSVSYLYSQRSGNNLQWIFSADTPYQRVEILEGPGRHRVLYLDGVRHYGSDSLSNFNHYISGIPASLLARPAVLIVGSGSMNAVYDALPYARSVDTVEIDEVVVESGRTHLREKPDPGTEALLREKWTLSVDDAKHFIKNTPKKFDMVVLDVASPLQMQVALLYSKEFFEIVSEKLTDNGILCLSLNGQLVRGSVAASRTTTTLLGVFRNLYVLAPPDDSSFAIAGNRIPFGRPELLKALAQRGFFKTAVLERPAAEAMLVSKDVMTKERMDIVLHWGIERLMHNYFKGPN